MQRWKFLLRMCVCYFTDLWISLCRPTSVDLWFPYQKARSHNLDLTLWLTWSFVCSPSCSTDQTVFVVVVFFWESTVVFYTVTALSHTMLVYCFLFSNSKWLISNYKFYFWVLLLKYCMLICVLHTHADTHTDLPTEFLLFLFILMFTRSVLMPFFPSRWHISVH